MSHPNGRDRGSPSIRREIATRLRHRLSRWAPSRVAVPMVSELRGRLSPCVQRVRPGRPWRGDGPRWPTCSIGWRRATTWSTTSSPSVRTGAGGAETVAAVAPRPGQRILDLAAGTGTSSRPFADAGRPGGSRRPVGRACSPWARQRQPDLTFVNADALALPFADGAFDAVTISFGLRNVEDVPTALAELRRVTRPGGRIVICEFSTPTWKPFRETYRSYLVQGAAQDRRADRVQPRRLRLPGRVDPGLARPARAGRADVRRRLARRRLEEPHRWRRRATPSACLMFTLDPYAARSCPLKTHHAFHPGTGPAPNRPVPRRACRGAPSSSAAVYERIVAGDASVARPAIAHRSSRARLRKRPALRRWTRAPT